MAIEVLTTIWLDEAAQAAIEKVLKPVDGVLRILPRERDAQESFMQTQLPTTEVIFTYYLSAEQLAQAHALKWIQVPAAGVNRLLQAQNLVENDVIVTNSAGVMAPPLADQVLGYILSFSRSLPQQFKAQERGEWLTSSEWINSKKLHLIELAGQTVGIVGYGKIGEEVAKRAKAFGMRVVATKTRPSGDYPNVDEMWSANELDRLLAESDYVVIAAPLTPQTDGLIGRAQLEKMKPSAYFINIARGQLVREQELIEVLREYKIAGAALDVFEQEPLPRDSPLWGLDNVILTPHSSGNFTGYMQRAAELFSENLRRYLSHEPLINVVDKQRGY